MTDHPSNPPSQTKGHEIVREWMTAYTSKARLAELIDSALAAQEARHKAAQDAGSLLLEGAGVRLREAQAHVRNHHLEACETCIANESTTLALESKLREAMEREKTLIELIEDAVWGARAAGLTEYSDMLEGKLAAIRSGPPALGDE